MVDFFTVAISWIEDSHFSWKQQFDVKIVEIIDLFLTNTFFYVCLMGWSGVDYLWMF